MGIAGLPLGKEGIELVEFLRDRIFERKTGGMLDLAHRRVERSIAVIRRALQHDAPMRLGADALEQRLDQPRLAHAGFGGEHDRLSLALLRQMPAVEQQAHFLRPADEGAETGGACRRKPAGDRRLL